MRHLYAHAMSPYSQKTVIHYVAKGIAQRMQVTHKPNTEKKILNISKRRSRDYRHGDCFTATQDTTTHVTPVFCEFVGWFLRKMKNTISTNTLSSEVKRLSMLDKLKCVPKYHCNSRVSQRNHEKSSAKKISKSFADSAYFWT